MRLQLVATSLFISHSKEATRNCSPVASPSEKLQLDFKTLVKACLINEESRQRTAQSVTTPNVTLAVTTATLKTRHPLSRSPASTVEKKVITKSIARNGKPMKQKALPLLSLKKRSKLGEVTGYVSLYSLCFLFYFILTILLCLWESVRYWMPTWQTHKTLIKLLVFDI